MYVHIPIRAARAPKKKVVVHNNRYNSRYNSQFSLKARDSLRTNTLACLEPVAINKYHDASQTGELEVQWSRESAF